MDDYADAAHTAVELLADHVAEARAGLGPVNVRPEPDELAEELELGRWIEQGGMDAAALEEWLPRYLDATVRLHHPGSMAHQVAVPSTGAAVADLIHGATNNPMAIYEMGAAGATIERVGRPLDARQGRLRTRLGRGAHARRVAREPDGAARRPRPRRTRRVAHGHARRSRAARAALRPLLGAAGGGDPRAR